MRRLLLALCALLWVACDRGLDVGVDPRVSPPADDTREPCVFEAGYTDIFGGWHRAWRIETDGEGFVSAWAEDEPGLLDRDLDRDELLWYGFGLTFTATVEYDRAGRIKALRHFRDDDGRLVEEELLSYRQDGGIDTHSVVRGKAYEDLVGSRIELFERRWLDGDVELIEEHRVQLWENGEQAMRSRTTERAADGSVLEHIDNDGDGADDRVARRVRHDGLLRETIEKLDGTVLSWSETQFDATGAAQRRLADSDGDGLADFRVVWAPADGSTAEVTRVGTDWSEVTRSRQGTMVAGAQPSDLFSPNDVPGVFVDAIEVDVQDDGAPEKAARFASFQGLLSQAS